jgi:protease I
MGVLEGKRVLVFVDDIYEDLELWYPKYRLIEEGATVVVAGPLAGVVYEGKHGYPCRADASLPEVRESDFDGLVIPGGFAPDSLRRREDVKKLTRAFHENGKLVAHICHGGWIPISAGIVRGFRSTSTPGIRDDLENAGATWVDEPVVVDRHQVSSRRPDDCPAFMRGIIEVMNRK